MNSRGSVQTRSKLCVVWMARPHGPISLSTQRPMSLISRSSLVFALLDFEIQSKRVRIMRGPSLDVRLEIQISSSGGAIQYSTSRNILSDSSYVRYRIAVILFHVYSPSLSTNFYNGFSQRPRAILMTFVQDSRSRFGSWIATTFSRNPLGNLVKREPPVDTAF